MTRAKGQGPQELANRHEIFLYEYARTGSLRAAERAAGYNTGYGCRLIRKPGMKEKLKEKLAKINEVEIVNTREILQEATFLALSDITDVMSCQSMDDIRNLEPRVRKAIKHVTVKQVQIERPDGSKETMTTLDITMHDKIKPLALLAMHAGIGDSIGKGAKIDKPFTGLKIITGGAGGDS